MSVSNTSSVCFQYASNIYAKARTGHDLSGKVVSVAQRIFSILQLPIAGLARFIGKIILLTNMIQGASVRKNGDVANRVHSLTTNEKNHQQQNPSSISPEKIKAPSVLSLPASQNQLQASIQAPLPLTTKPAIECKLPLPVPPSVLPLPLTQTSIPLPSMPSGVPASTSIQPSAPILTSLQLSAPVQPLPVVKSSTFEDEVMKLHSLAEKMSSCSCMTELSQMIESMQQNIAKMIGDTQYKEFKKELNVVQQRLKDIANQIAQNTTPDVSLDCFGIVIKLRSMFRQKLSSLIPSTIPFVGHESTLAAKIHDVRLKEIEEYILSHKYDINLPSGVIVGFAIRKACELGEKEPQKALELIKTIIRAGGELNATDSQRLVVPPLHSVCMAKSLKNKEEMLKLLLSNGANPNLKGGKYLTEQVGPLPPLLPKLFQRGLLTEDMIQLLIDNGLDVNMKGKNSETALGEALLLKQDGLAKRLVFNGADHHIAGLSQANTSKIAEWLNVRNQKMGVYSKKACLTGLLIASSSMKKFPVDVLAMVTKYCLNDASISKFCYSREAKV